MTYAFTHLNMHIALLAALEIARVHLLSTAPGSEAATSKPKFVRQGEEAMLVVAVETKDGKLYAGTPKVDLGNGKIRKAEPWPVSEALTVDWFKVEATDPYVDNEEGGFHWDTITYVETAWPDARAEKASPLARPGDVRATVHPDRGGLGTMTFKVVVTAGGKTLATPGKEDVYRGGVSANVHRLTVRKDDTFLGYLTELYNTPYIWASAGSAGVHQADRNIGSDCADLMVYGMRRAGKNIDYGSTYDVPRWGGKKAIASIATKADDGRFVDERGNAIKVGDGGVKRGDLVLFNRHVGAFSEDREPLGVFDANDLLIHTAWAPPAEESFTQSKQWTSPPFSVWRVPIP